MLPMTTCYRGIFLEVTLFKNATFSRFRLFYMQRIKFAEPPARHSQCYKMVTIP